MKDENAPVEQKPKPKRTTAARVTITNNSRAPIILDGYGSGKNPLVLGTLSDGTHQVSVSGKIADKMRADPVIAAMVQNGTLAVGIIENTSAWFNV